MLRVPVVVVAAALSAGLASSASATTVPGSPIPIFHQSSASNLQLAAHRKVYRRVWVYNRRVHGPRFGYRHGRYRYYYGGWWYPRPWWAVGPGVGIAVAPGYGYAYPGYVYGAPGYDAYGDSGYAYGDSGYSYGDSGYAGGAPDYADEGDQGYADEGGGEQGYADNGGGGEEGYGGGEGDEHVQWCMNHYRTYDPQSDTYMSSNGRVRCPGPYLK